MSYDLLVVATSDADELDHIASVVRTERAERLQSPTGLLQLWASDGPHTEFAKLVTDPAGAHVVLATSTAALQVDDALHERGMERAILTARSEADGSVSIRNDGVGFYPMYWTATPKRLMASTSLQVLARALRNEMRWDADAVLQYLTMLHPLDDRTLVKDVNTLPAGALLAWRPEVGVRLTSRPLFTPQSSGSPSNDEVIQRFGALWPTVLQDVWARNEGSRLLVGLSGGLDSRAIASGLTQNGSRATGITYTRPGNRESEVALHVADRLGMPHLRLPISESVMLNFWSQTVSMLDGVHSPAETYEGWFHADLRQHGDVLVSGLWGGPLWGGDKALGLRTAEAVADSVLHRTRGALLRAARLMDMQESEALHRFRSALVTSIEPFEDGRGDMSVFWNVQTRQRRWGLALPTVVRRIGLRLEAPFLDARILRLLASLSPEQRRYGSMHLRVHRQLFPETAHIPRGNDGNSPAALNHVYWSGDETLTRQLATLAFRHPVSAARRASLFGRQKLAESARGTRLDHAFSAARVRDDLFDAHELSVTSPTYRRRLNETVATAATSPHPLLDAELLRASADALATGKPTTLGPLALARAATLSEWHREWCVTEAPAVR